MGRILRNRFGEIERIIEDKDATDIQKQIKEINTGIYCLSGRNLYKWLPELNNNNSQKEYYLTDIVNFAHRDNINIRSTNPANNFEILGVNTRQQLAQLERIWQKSVANRLMSSGVSLADPNRFDIRGNAEIGSDTWIDLNVLIEGTVTIGENCTIGANCILNSCILGNYVVVKPHTIIDSSVIASHSIIGPFARIRPNTVINENTKIGNFVEVKNSTLGRDVKVNHLSYIGDSKIGKKCNIGAGVITCNYDGINKYKTVIDDNVFIGSDSQLIAPIHIGQGSNIAAGSTIVKDVPKYGLTINRADQQTTIRNWKRPPRCKKDKIIK